MPSEDLNLLRASRVAEASQRYQDEVERVGAAETVVVAARSEAERAVSAADKKVAAERLRQAEQQLAQAQDRLGFEERQLAAILQGWGGPSSSGGGSWLPYVQYGVFSLMALLGLGILIGGIWQGDLLTVLASTPTARGLITFLIAVITVTIALVLTLATVVSDSVDRARRFQQGKEVLTVLIGVLGTIVGFYFGHAVEEATNPEGSTAMQQTEAPNGPEGEDSAAPQGEIAPAPPAGDAAPERSVF